VIFLLKYHQNPPSPEEIEHKKGREKLLKKERKKRKKKKSFKSLFK
jgi:hypothetical protein